MTRAETPAETPAETRADQERGAATIWTAIAVTALLCVVAFAFWLGSAAIARHRAEGAADLAALAAAGVAHRGSGPACDLARLVAERMATRLVGCRLDADDALVEVSASAPGVPLNFGSVGARARAGPAVHPRQ
ncbi:MAG: putative rane protein [Amycolatopsis sp.]|uniref:Rv3654c family TadE-like protein n=1 Tax=Amycolatopsis sp. TaxID=37632 RepID=UPI002623899A|nr:Rv3654c family TadE-like protein [Amycolatopsis sp.]MCU1684959.1 putative rane protein [Amycolatopsis sp.]